MQEAACERHQPHVGNERKMSTPGGTWPQLYSQSHFFSCFSLSTASKKNKERTTFLTFAAVMGRMSARMPR